MFTYPIGPADVVEHFRQYFGPTQKHSSSLMRRPSRIASDLEALVDRAQSGDDGTTEVE